MSHQLDWLEERQAWSGLNALGVVESQRERGDQIRVERRYFLCSGTDLEHFAHSVRAHGCIENQPHWILDVEFGEDAHRTRIDHSPENLALIRRMALNLVRQNGQPRESIRRRRLRAGLNDRYRWQLLTGKTNIARLPCASPWENLAITYLGRYRTRAGYG